MAVFQVNFFSDALKRIVNFSMVLPNDVIEPMRIGNENYNREMKTLYLLHGFSGNNIDWMMGSLAMELSAKYNMAIVMPSGENSFYLNQKGTGKAYETFVGKELVDYVRKTFGVSDKKEDTFIGGLSMGGFGAIHTALKYPENYGKMFGLSSALIVNNIKNMAPGTNDVIADYDYYSATFGDLTQLEESENNPEQVIRMRQKNGETIQPIYMACGTEDFLLRENREFHQFLTEHKVNVTYRESTGIHDWKFWNEYLEPAMQWLLEE